MKQRQLTTTKLAALLEGKITRSTVYNYVQGRTDLASSKLIHFFDVLDIQLVLTGGTGEESGYEVQIVQG